jgi:hypothetical protein
MSPSTAAAIDIPAASADRCPDSEVVFARGTTSNENFIVFERPVPAQ